MKFRFAPPTRSRKTRTSGLLQRRPSLETMENRLAPAAIVGSVFNDLDGDGIRQNTEPGMGGVPVFIDFNNNGKFDPPTAGTIGDVGTLTAPDGKYQLLTNAVGSFNVLQVVPPNFTQTTTNPTLVTLPPTVPPGNTLIHGPTFGNKHNAPPPPTVGGTIHGAVFIDGNGDGIRQSTEHGQSGVRVFIDLNNDGKYTPPTTATTPGEPFVLSGLNGSYSLKVGKDGTYSVLEVVPPGFTMTTGVPAPVVVSGGATVAGPLFGNQLLPPPPVTGGTIHGHVFIDVNGDGVRQNTEPGHAGVIVFLDLNGDGKLSPGTSPTTPGEPHVVSNQAGGYAFKVAKDGNYSVLEIVPPNFTMTTPVPAPVAVAGGANVAGPDFGNKHNAPPVQLGFITGRVFRDNNANGKHDPGEHGMGGVRVYDDANGNSQFDSGERFTFSQFTGRYALGLPAGPHTVLEVVPAGFTQTAGPGLVTIVAGQALFNQHFGNAPNGPAPVQPFAPPGGSSTEILTAMNNDDSEGVNNAFAGTTNITFQGAIMV